MRKIYLSATPLEEALKQWLQWFHDTVPHPLSSETVPVRDAQGRITAEALFALISSPTYHAAAMDGYAVRFADTFGAGETTPKRLLLGQEAIPVDTGDPMPTSFNAVIMLEHANRVTTGDTDCIEILQPASPWQHVRVIGEDIVATELVVPENHLLRPVDISALLSSGHVQVSVRRSPKVVLIPTGSELIEPGSMPREGEIIEYNTGMLAALVAEWGGIPFRFPPVKDSIADIRNAVTAACESGDIVVINAGSSAGSEDYTASVIAELGEVMVHGINIKPGKPVILGRVGRTPIIGIPGYPVSAFLTFRLFCRELVYLLQGVPVPESMHVRALLSRQAPSALGQEEFLRVKLGRVGKNMIATPVGRGAGLLMSLVRADGIVRIPSQSEGLGAGTEVDVELLRSSDEIEHTVVCIGSHDNAIDLLANRFKKNHPRCSLSSAHVGSMGGILAIKKGEAHIAGTHLLDDESGEYNVPFLKRYLHEIPVILINLVYRQQGFILPAGNPKTILGFEDLIRKDVTFINRQGGSGTRLLTDMMLRNAGLRSADIAGYDREEYTHMGIASAVLTGVADVGMGILAAAQALGLDFVPVARERYDIVVPAEFIELESVRSLLSVIRDDTAYRKEVESLGGYDVSDMGRILYES